MVSFPASYSSSSQSFSLKKIHGWISAESTPSISWKCAGSKLKKCRYDLPSDHLGSCLIYLGINFLIISLAKKEAKRLAKEAKNAAKSAKVAATAGVSEKKQKEKKEKKDEDKPFVNTTPKGEKKGMY